MSLKCRIRIRIQIQVHINELGQNLFLSGPNFVLLTLNDETFSYVAGLLIPTSMQTMHVHFVQKNNTDQCLIRIAACTGKGYLCPLEGLQVRLEAGRNLVRHSI
jgi:hypothetical protein